MEECDRDWIHVKEICGKDVLLSPLSSSLGLSWNPESSGQVATTPHIDTHLDESELIDLLIEGDLRGNTAHAQRETTSS